MVPYFGYKSSDKCTCNLSQALHRSLSVLFFGSNSCTCSSVPPNNMGLMACSEVIEDQKDVSHDTEEPKISLFLLPCSPWNMHLSMASINDPSLP
jgi:hypothetical protein